MRESRTYGSVRGALSNERPYRDPFAKPIVQEAPRWVSQGLNPSYRAVNGLVMSAPVETLLATGQA